MAALTSDRLDKRMRAGGYSRTIVGKLDAATKIYNGAITATNAAGYHVNASNVAGLVVSGVAEAQVDNTTGVAGDKEIAVITGVFRLLNDAINPVVQADMGKICFVADNQTVRTAGGACAAGIVELIEPGFVWVRIDPDVTATYAARNAV